MELGTSTAGSHSTSNKRKRSPEDEDSISGDDDDDFDEEEEEDDDDDDDDISDDEPNDLTKPRRGVGLSCSVENDCENLEEGAASDDEVEGATSNKADSEAVAKEPFLDREKVFLEKALKAQNLKSTAKEYDGIKVTPFNLKEELQEGHFDKFGNFIFKEQTALESSEDDDDDDDDEDLKNDHWAESVDWKAVEREELQRKEGASTSGGRTSADKKPPKPERPPLNKRTCYIQMLRIMRPEETVQKAIKRLGLAVPKRRPPIKASRPGAAATSQSSADADQVAEAKAKLDTMIDSAHQLVEYGDIDIYQKSYEQLEAAIN